MEGYIIHNDTQISVKIDSGFKLFTVENVDDFIIENNLQGKEIIQVPEIITRRQFKIALAILGKNENDILNGINQLSEPTKTIANISYKEAGTFERNNAELIFVAKTFLQLTDEQINEIFIKGNEF